MLSILIMDDSVVIKKLQLDWLLILCILGLYVSSLVVFNAYNIQDPKVISQISRLSIACFGLILVLLTPTKILLRSGPILFALSITMLLMTFIFWYTRWLYIFGISFQPSELARLAVPLCLVYHAKYVEQTPSLAHYLIRYAIIGLPCFLIFIQPDLSMTINVLIAGYVTLWLLGKLDKLLILLTCASPALWLILRDYQKLRIINFFNPNYDPLFSGHQILSAKIVLGASGLTGLNTLFSFPGYTLIGKSQFDFGYLLLAKHFGYIGCLFILSLFLILLVRSLYLTMKRPDNHYEQVLASTFCVIIALNVFFNVSINTGILPVSGLPLAFFSIGGSHLLITNIMLGFILKFTSHNEKVVT